MGDDVITIAKRKYAVHKAGAKRRGIDFDMTFEEWWQIWEPRFADRGPRRGNLVMCRRLDAGGYSVGNVRLDTPAGNAADRKAMNAVRRQWAKEDGKLLPIKPSTPSPNLYRPGAAPDWMDRHRVFDEYTDDDES